MGTQENRKQVKIVCTECGGKVTNHEILVQVELNWSDGPYDGATTNQICRCQGCDFIRFRQASSYCADLSQSEFDIRVYPENNGRRIQATAGHDQFPPDVQRMYLETIKVMNAGAAVLAGGGLRSIVEAICKHQAVKGNDLQQKIDQLVAQGLLAVSQAALLHEERFLGNASLHELDPPSQRELELGLQIIEGLLNAIYVLPNMANELKAKRLAKKKKTSP